MLIDYYENSVKISEICDNGLCKCAISLQWNVWKWFGSSMQIPE
uniref:Uncharacterized protein n=1 Tax=Anguilla anguilla TaxID=7936 RepID=A0A0E9QIH5_ANGAN